MNCEAGHQAVGREVCLGQRAMECALDRGPLGHGPAFSKTLFFRQFSLGYDTEYIETVLVYKRYILLETWPVYQ